MPFTIAIIGRPNVGKSTLFNRLVGQKLALVDDQPGVTRDRREGNGRLGDLEFRLIDTAGLDKGARGSLTARMQEQTEIAIAAADALMFVIDARMGLTPSDREFADFARRADKPVVLVANKSEGTHGDAGALESYALGLGQPIPISAEHGEGMSDLYDALRDLMPVPAPEGEAADDEDSSDEFADVELSDEEIATRPIRVAVLGRPNAGKSTLINFLLGEERLLTSPEAGTTRDSISVEVRWKSRDFRVFDTAGLRRRSRIDDKLERLSVSDALRAVRFAEVVVLVMDAQNKFEEQDLRLADLVEREGRAIVIAVNKWDLMERAPNQMTKLREEADHWLPQVKGMPVVAVSGLMGEGVDRLMVAIQDAYAVWNRRVSTSQLNRWFEQAVTANPPPAKSGVRMKLNYATQVKARPPSFVMFCTRADSLPESYLRYLINSIRSYFDLPGTPIRITLREKENPFAHKRNPLAHKRKKPS
ncbi:MAG: ribosome biogenesis GTPase Der [Afipia sp.]|nr:ribosome biogenesis GTPase Der [Afipia sp.]